MKRKMTLAGVALIALVTLTPPAHAQFLKKLGDRLKEKVDQRSSQKADAAMDQGLDKAEAGIDQVAQQTAEAPGDNQGLAAGSGTAADCAHYYYLAHIGEIQMTSYTKKDDPAVVVTYKISDVKDIPGGVQSNVQSEVVDKKGNKIGGGEGVYSCKNGNLSADMRVVTTSAPMEQFKGMDVEATEAYLVYPGQMAVGESLPDGAFHMTVTQKGNLFATVDYAIQNRRISGKEQVTTPVGTWTCFRIDYTVSMKIKTVISIPIHYAVTEWFAPGFGVVKAVNYNKKHQPQSYALLTRMKQ